MNCARLIQLVRSNPALYDQCHQLYTDHKAKEKMWIDIGAELNQPAHNCKRVWVNLRDSYKRIVRNKKKKAEQGVTELRTWRHEKDMAFLYPFFKGHFVNKSDIVKTEQTTDSGSWSQNPPTPEYSGSTVSDSSVYDDNIVNTVKIEIDDDDDPKWDEENTYELLPIKRKIIENDITSNKQIKTLESCEVSKMDDALSSFFSSMCSTVKSFHPYYQHLAKTKIFNIVSELELQILKENPSTQNIVNGENLCNGISENF